MKIKKLSLTRIIIFVTLLLISVTTLFPFYFMIVSSLKPRAEYFINYFGLPSTIYFKNFIQLFENHPIIQMTFNSAIVNFATQIFSITITTMAGFIFTKFPYKWSDKIEMAIIASMMVPPVVLMIPLYLMMSSFNLINNHLSLILYYTAIVLPFSLYLTTSNFKNIPNECIESAKMDGAGLFKIYTNIILPLGKPVVFTLLTLNFLWCWNEFLYSMLLLQRTELRTLTVGVALVIGKRTVDMPLLLTGLFINCIPVLVIFAAVNKYFVKGMTAGAVKG